MVVILKIQSVGLEIKVCSMVILLPITPNKWPRNIAIRFYDPAPSEIAKMVRKLPTPAGFKSYISMINGASVRPIHVLSLSSDHFALPLVHLVTPHLSPTLPPCVPPPQLTLSTGLVLHCRMHHHQPRHADLFSVILIGDSDASLGLGDVDTTRSPKTDAGEALPIVSTS